MSEIKIVWVKDNRNGPLNGLIEYDNKQLWFARITQPVLVSSTSIPVPLKTIDQPLERIYFLYQLTDESMQDLVNYKNTLFKTKRYKHYAFKPKGEFINTIVESKITNYNTFQLNEVI